VQAAHAPRGGSPVFCAAATLGVAVLAYHHTVELLRILHEHEMAAAFNLFLDVHPSAWDPRGDSLLRLRIEEALLLPHDSSCRHPTCSRLGRLRALKVLDLGLVHGGLLRVLALLVGCWTKMLA